MTAPDAPAPRGNGDDEHCDYIDGDELEEWEFDCHMLVDKRGFPLGCGMAGSEECDFECPYLREFERMWDKRNKRGPR